MSHQVLCVRIGVGFIEWDMKCTTEIVRPKFSPILHTTLNMKSHISCSNETSMTFHVYCTLPTPIQLHKMQTLV